MAVSRNFMEWVGITKAAYRRDFYVTFNIFDNERVDKKVKRGVVAVDKRTGKTAISRCSYGDTFNSDIGKAIAYARLRGLTVPPLESYKIRECVGKYIKFKNIIYYVTPVTIPYGGELDYFCMALPTKGSPYIAQIGENCEVEIVK